MVKMKSQPIIQKQIDVHNDHCYCPFCGNSNTVQYTDNGLVFNKETCRHNRGTMAGANLWDITILFKGYKDEMP